MLREDRFNASSIDGFNIKQLHEWVDEIENTARRLNAVDNIRIVYEFYGYDGAYEMYVVFDRPETEEEREQREISEAKLKALEEKKKQKKEAHERKQLDYLMNKYKVGGKSCI